jgi:hypothetical protein
MRWHVGDVRVGRALVIFVLLLIAAAPASAHASLTITIDPPSRPQEAGSDTYLVGTRTPTFHIQASDIPAGYEVRCQVDDPPDGPCGTQDAQCPVQQCWTFNPSFSSDSFASNGDGHTLTVSVQDPTTFDDSESDGLSFDIDSTPPDTKLVGVKGPDYPLEFPYSTRRVAFGFGRADEDSYDGTFQCAITSPGVSAPPSWSKCSSGQVQPQKLALTAKYLFWVRAVDFLGRPDPTPVSYLFSPTPCHLKVVSPPHKLRAIVQHGLKLRMTCVNAVPFETQLLLNNAQTIKLGLPSSLLGLLDGDAPSGSKTFTLRTYKGLPKTLFRQKKLFVGLRTSTIGAGPKLVELKLHR